MNLLSDSWSVVAQHAGLLLSFLVCISWGAILVVAALKYAAGQNLSISDLTALGLAGWPLPVLLVSLFVFLLGVFTPARPGVWTLGIFLLVTGGAAIFAIQRIKPGMPLRDAKPAIALGVIFLLLVILRLAFVSKALLPLYFDSAEHVRITQLLAEDYQRLNPSGKFIWPVPVYYHVGLHVILAVLMSSIHVDIKSALLVIGQISVAATAIPLFVIVRQETESESAGLFAVILAGLGWLMPAHSMNWGKYPALFSLAPLQFTLGAAYLASKYKSRKMLFLALIGTGLSTLIHSRSIIVIFAAGLSWLLTSLWMRLNLTRRILAFALLLAGLAIEIILVLGNEVLSPLFGPYVESTVPVTIMVGLLSVFALKKYPRLTFYLILVVAVCLVGLYVPVPGNPFLTILDRPLIEMLLFIPFSILGGLGFAGLFDLMYQRNISNKLLKTSLAVFLAIGVMTHALTTYSFYPSDCCGIVSTNDLAALDWVKENLPGTSRILIASTEIKMSALIPSSTVPGAGTGASTGNWLTHLINRIQNWLKSILARGLASSSGSFETSAPIVGTDAGIWITPLVDRTTASLPYTTDFSQQSTLDTLCQQDISYIYIGGTSQSFAASSIRETPNWYQIVLYFPNAQVYQVIGCPP